MQKLLMRKMFVIGFLGMNLLSTSGCASIISRKYPKESCGMESTIPAPRYFYGGVRCSAAYFTLPYTIPVGLVDMPLSFAADTLLLPWDTYNYLKR